MIPTALSRLVVVAIALAGRTATAQSVASKVADDPDSVVAAFNRAMLARDWSGAAALTDSTELSRLHSVFEPALRNERAPGSFRRWILGISTPGEFPRLSDVEFAGKLLEFFIRSSQDPLRNLTGVETLGHSGMRGDTTWVVYRWTSPADSAGNPYSNSAAVIKTKQGWRAVRLANLDPILPFIK